MVDDEQFRARGLFTEVVHPTAGPIPQVAAPLAGQVDATTLAIHDQAVPCTEEVLGAVGFSDDELSVLRADGVIA